MKEQDNKQQEENNTTQIQCLSCGSCKIQLISIRKISKAKTELNIICEVCGLLMVAGAGELEQPKPKNPDKQPEYLG